MFHTSIFKIFRNVCVYMSVKIHIKIKYIYMYIAENLPTMHFCSLIAQISSPPPQILLRS